MSHSPPLPSQLAFSVYRALSAFSVQKCHLILWPSFLSYILTLNSLFQPSPPSDILLLASTRSGLKFGILCQLLQHGAPTRTFPCANFQKYPRAVFNTTLNSQLHQPCSPILHRGYLRTLSRSRPVLASCHIILGRFKVLLASLHPLKSCKPHNTGFYHSPWIFSPPSAPPLGFSFTYGNPGITSSPPSPAFLCTPFAYSYGVLDRFLLHAAPTSTNLSFSHISSGVLYRLSLPPEPTLSQRPYRPLVPSRAPLLAHCIPPLGHLVPQEPLLLPLLCYRPLFRFSFLHYFPGRPPGSLPILAMSTRTRASKSLSSPNNRPLKASKTSATPPAIQKAKAKTQRKPSLPSNSFFTPKSAPLVSPSGYSLHCLCL